MSWRSRIKPYGFHILLIDDDEDDCLNIRDLLKEIPGDRYQLTWKSNYKDGLLAIQEQQYDACLLDYRLGAQTGLEFLREVHKLGVSCPIIFLTGHSDFDIDLQAMQTGAADYLVKGQLTALLLERSIRYSMKHALDMEELKDSKAQILQQDRLASLGLLASSLAHEIGTPLGVIRSRAELARKKAIDNTSLSNDMDTVILQIDKITKLVNSLLHLARGKHSSTASAVNFNKIIQDILTLLQHEFDRKSIELKAHVPENIFVKAEDGPLGQVLLNLLINSVHAIEEEQEKGRKENHSVTLSVDIKNDLVEIVITDTGCGIPEKNIPQLFKPFFTTKDIGHGTGLGLATSYQLIQSWNGSITVKSDGVSGATFTIRLPKISNS